MFPPVARLSRTFVYAALFTLSLGTVTPAAAATRLFVVANELASIWEVDPVTGNKIAETPLVPPVAATRCGLAYDGTYLYYTDENLAVVQAYVPGGGLDHTLPKPAGLEPGSGLGATKTSVFLVALNGVITEISSANGSVLGSFTITGAQHGLTYAGSRGSLFVAVNDSPTLEELSPTGALVNTITAGDVFRGLAFSSSTGTLFGVRQGFLWAVNPQNGDTLTGYPVQIHDDVTNLKLLKSAAAAADEPVLEICGDGAINRPGETCEPPSSTQTNGQVCRADCTYCGDEVVDQGAGEQCDDGNTDNLDDCRNDCTLPRCGDGVTDTGEACDDGNTTNGDGCDENCAFEGFCGDGVVQPQLGEQCEPPNTATCDANCHPLEICLDLIDNDGDGQIDCSDPDCDCLPIGRDPGAIRFGRQGADDLFAVHGSLKPGTGMNASTDEISFLLTNADGKVYQLVIPAGDVKQLGKNLYRYKNNLAQRQRSGLARFDLRYYPRRDNFTFVVKAYGDLSKATLAEMSVQLVIGDDGFLNKSTWLTTPAGWKLTLPGE